MLPSAEQAPPSTGVALPEDQKPPEQVKPATVTEPVHAPPIAGVIQVAPLQ